MGVERLPGWSIDKHNDTAVSKVSKKSHVGVFLRYCGSEDLTNAQISLSMLNQLPNNSDAPKEFKKEPFSTQRSTLGDDLIIKQSVLADETEGFKVEDSVIIEATIILGGELQSTVESAPVYAFAETLKTDLSQLLTSGVDSDFNILLPLSVGTSDLIPKTADTAIGNNIGHSFQVHSLILKARSSYFRAMMSSSIETTKRQIIECDVQPAVFEEVLNYIYTDSLSEGAIAVMGEWLLLAANKYDLEALKQLCEGQLCQSLSIVKVSAAEVMQTSGWACVTSYQGGVLAFELMQELASASIQARRQASGKGKDLPVHLNSLVFSQSVILASSCSLFLVTWVVMVILICSRARDDAVSNKLPSLTGLENLGLA
jgi:hypothetical protein